jgi:hypothetical protein
LFSLHVSFSFIFRRTISGLFYRLIMHKLENKLQNMFVSFRCVLIKNDTLLGVFEKKRMSVHISDLLLCNSIFHASDECGQK